MPQPCGCDFDGCTQNGLVTTHPPGPAEFTAAGLYDEQASDAPDRLALLAHLAAQGASIDEMQIAEREERLAWLGVDRMLTSGDALSLTEVARRTNVTEDVVLRVQRAMGLPASDGPLYSEGNVAMFAGASQLFGLEATLQFSRVIGASLSRIVDAAMSVFLAEVQVPLVEEQAAAIERARQGEQATELLLQLPTVLQVLWPYYVADAVRRFRLSDPQATGGLRAAIGFVDLVDSTRLVQQLSGAELARAVGDFESAATDIAVSHDGRVVKFIGDAAMFAAPDPSAACAIGLQLCETVEHHATLRAARGAIGYGTVLAQDGDFYGSVVNQASRLTAVANPGQLLGTLDLQAAVEAQPAPYRFEPAGSHRLRGFDEPLSAVAIVRA